MPTPQEGESEDDYMKRCMAYPDMQQYEPSQRAAICHSKYREASTKAQPFARFSNMDACTIEMGKLGHLITDCKAICNGIFERAVKGALLKAAPQGLEVLSKAGEDDIVLGGYASWAVTDDDGDYFTAEAQSKALERFFNQPPEYRSITINHGRSMVGEVTIAQPLLKYVDKAGNEHFSHVNEAGTYLISKLRSDPLKVAQIYRQKAKAGELNGYSVNAFPLEKDPVDPHKVLDMEYSAITITEKGVFKPRNPMTRDVKVLSKGEKCECDTSQCNGACCTFITQSYPDSTDTRRYFELHGLEMKANLKGQLFVKFPVQCKAFDAENCLCKAHDSRPEACRVYPQHESPFIAKSKCSLLLEREQSLVKAQKEDEKPSLNGEKSLDVELILQKHGFNKTI